MTGFQLLSLMVSLTALGGYLNHFTLRLPATIGYMAFALSLSLLAILLHQVGWLDAKEVSSLVAQMDLSKTLLHGILGFLLFAGALHISFNELKEFKWPLVVLAVGGVVLATFITGSLLWGAAQVIGLNLSYMYALLFGALISPTDPIAVLSILKKLGLSRRLYVQIGSESLFNDGIGVVAFLTILGIATQAEPVNAASVATLLAREALGGGALGLVLGWVVYRMLRPIEEHSVEILLTLSIATGGYALAEALHVSAPICMVMAGLVIGNHGREHAMSEETRHRLDIFWELLDDILNAVLFMLIGLEIMVITIHSVHVLMGIVAICSVLLGRLISMALPIGLMRTRFPFEKSSILLFTWGGLRGGLSVAMALSLPRGMEKDLLLPMAYIVVLFSVLAQGLTFGPILRRLQRNSPRES